MLFKLILVSVFYSFIYKNQKIICLNSASMLGNNIFCNKLTNLHFTSTQLSCHQHKPNIQSLILYIFYIIFCKSHNINNIRFKQYLKYRSHTLPLLNFP